MISLYPAPRLDSWAGLLANGPFDAAGQKGRPDEQRLLALLASAYPALRSVVETRAEEVCRLYANLAKARDRATLSALLEQAEAGSGPDDWGAALRRFAVLEKTRVAAREITRVADVDETAAELSLLASVCIERALVEAVTWADERFGAPRTMDGARCAVCVLGMGKLGGGELNPGSDIDLVVLYETDEGCASRADGGSAEVSLHEYFSRVTRRMVATLEEQTADGMVWRVDLRLRPEGSRGPLVYSLVAAERYYETFGRTWERAALLRATPVAGDPRFGATVMRALSPFVWSKRVSPEIVPEIASLLARARVEYRGDVTRNIKLGEGGIREVEFFVQSLSLVWGGLHAELRHPNTLEAARRLRALGYLSDREEADLVSAYLFLRRAEHFIQTSTGIQTHELPVEHADRERMAQCLGLGNWQAFANEAEAVRRRVRERYAELLGNAAPPASPTAHILAALDADDDDVLSTLVGNRLGLRDGDESDLGQHLRSLARHSEGPLGARTRDHEPGVAMAFLDAILEASDPEQAAHYFEAFFSRLVTKAPYVRLLAKDPTALRRLSSAFGGSAFVAEALVGHPDLVEAIVLGHRNLGADAIDTAWNEEWEACAAAEDELERLLQTVRRTRARVTVELGLRELSGDISVREAMKGLSLLADRAIAECLKFALAERGLTSGLSVIAMGKLGSREIGYGSDLDIFFLYDAVEDDYQAAEQYTRVAQRVLRLMTTPHASGPAYELDTRLRPSGSHGLLVTSLDGFLRYHETRAAGWERQALLRARPVAGDDSVASRFTHGIVPFVYERPVPDPEELLRIRSRMERELSGERRSADAPRYDLKFGPGGLIDVEFAVQFLQLKFGRDPSVRSKDTREAIGSLELSGYITHETALALAEGYEFLRQLQQKLRIVHNSAAHLIETGAPGLAPLARRMGYRSRGDERAEDLLLADYVHVTDRVRREYLAILRH